MTKSSDPPHPGPRPSFTVLEMLIVGGFVLVTLILGGEEEERKEGRKRRRRSRRKGRRRKRRRRRGRRPGALEDLPVLAPQAASGSRTPASPPPWDLSKILFIQLQNSLGLIAESQEYLDVCSESKHLSIYILSLSWRTTKKTSCLKEQMSDLNY